MIYDCLRVLLFGPDLMLCRRLSRLRYYRYTNLKGEAEDVPSLEISNTAWHAKKNISCDASPVLCLNIVISAEYHTVQIGHRRHLP